MNTRGNFVEHDWKPRFDKQLYNIQTFHFLYTTKSRDAFNTPLHESQYVNHIGGSKSITTKVGLTHTMNNLTWKTDRDINETFPSCFDLSDPDSEETQNFLDYAKFGQIIAFFINVFQLTEIPDTLKSALICGTAYLNRRCHMLSGEVFLLCQVNKNAVEDAHPLDSITDPIYKWFKADKFPTEPPQWLKELLECRSRVGGLSGCMCRRHIGRNFECHVIPWA